MSAATTFERRNRQIQDAIDGQNLKQALQLCEKRIKKGEDTHFLKAWKANILSSYADDAHRQRGVTESLELSRLEPPVTDPNALDLLYGTLSGLQEHAATARGLWEKAAKAKPRELDIQLKWFNLGCEAGDWKTAQKAAMSLQTNFPKERKYYFWAIFMCYLISADPSNSETDRKLFGTLAYRMISKAASSIPTDPKQLLSQPRAIQTAEELFLLLKIFESQERYGEAVTILDSKSIGIDSRIAQNDWSFVRAKLANLERAASWEESLSYTRELLTLPGAATNGTTESASQEKDDWSVWGLLLTAAGKIVNEEKENDALAFVTDYIARQPKSRNAQLARLELTKQRVDSKKLTPEDLLSECKAYFDRNCNKLYCFYDLRGYLNMLHSGLQESFFAYVSQVVNARKSKNEGEEVKEHQRGVEAINALKFEYCFKLSFEDGKSAQEVEDFVRRCLQEYHTSQKSNDKSNTTESQSAIESQPADDLCLLAAMSLVRLHESDLDAKPYRVPKASLIQAAAVIENLLIRSPHNYEALLLLVRIYLLLGAGSLALKAFSKLSVKQMQYETVAHNLFTRLGSIHPQSAPPFEGLEKKDFDPQAAMKMALSFYLGAEHSAVQSRRMGLEHGSYINVEGSIEVHKRLRNSISRKMWALEVRRMQRLVGGESMAKYDHIIADMDKVDLIDNRNFDGFTNCERPGAPNFEEHVRIGSLPRDQTVKAMLAKDHLFAVLDCSLSQKKLPYEIDLSAFDNLKTNLEAELTPAELDNLEIHIILLASAVSASGISSKKGDSSSPTVGHALSEAQAWLDSKAKTLSTPTPASNDIIALPLDRSQSPALAPSWIYLHSNISLLETLKAIDLFVTFATKTKLPASQKPSKESIDKVKALVEQVRETIKSNTQALKSQIGESGMLGHLVSVIMGASPDNAEAGQQAQTDGVDAKTANIAKEVEDLMDTASLELFCGSLMDSWDEALDGVLSMCASMCASG